MFVYTIGVTISREVGAHSKALLKPFSKVSLSYATVAYQHSHSAKESSECLNLGL